MPVQSSQNQNTRPFIIAGYPYGIRKDNAVLLQDGGRSGDLLSKTLMAQITNGANAGKWVPYTNASATNGTAIPSGIYDPEGVLGDIPEADIQAGDVPDLPILIGGARFDSAQLVIENSLTLATEIAATTVNATTVAKELNKIGLVPENVDSSSEPENA